MYKILATIVFVILSLTLSAQYLDENMPEVTPMGIPSAPAFGLLGVNPEIISKPSDVKEFKVDWRIKNYKLAPDLALEAQPLWYLYYRKKSPSYYSTLDPVQRILSTTSLSLATAKIDNANHLSYAVKLNVYKEHDPYLDTKRVKSKEDEIKKETKKLIDTLESLRIQLSKENDLAKRDSFEQQIEYNRWQVANIKNEKIQEFKEESIDFVIENWNMDMVDLAFGRVYKYDNDAFDSLNFQKAGYGIWINAAKGIGKNGLVTAMIKSNRIGKNNDLLIGASYRYGSERYNFFAELVMNRMQNMFENGFDDEEQFANLRAPDLGQGWYMFEEGEERQTYWTMSYGGDFKLSKNILLNFSLRTELNGDLSFKRFLPIANIICLMK